VKRRNLRTVFFFDRQVLPLLKTDNSLIQIGNSPHLLKWLPFQTLVQTGHLNGHRFQNVPFPQCLTQPLRVLAGLSVFMT